MNPIRILCLIIMLALSVSAFEKIDLSGRWELGLDRAAVGEEGKWFTRSFPATILLPGSVQEARMGDPIAVDTQWTGSIFDKSYYSKPRYAPYRETGNIKMPFWLQPETHYTGAAWYRRKVEIPESWAGLRIALLLERPHWTTKVWIDDRFLGGSDANSVPHVYQLPAELASGEHWLTLCVDNRLDPDIGENSHSMSDHTQGNWNGIVGRMELVANKPVWIERLDVFPDVQAREVSVKGKLERLAGLRWPGKVLLEGAAGSLGQVSADVAEDGTFTAIIRYGSQAGLWDEFSPMLHVLTASLENGEKKELRFGFRKIGADGRQLTINGRSLFLRGALDCAFYPKTGHPPTDVAGWRRVLGVIKAHGLNHVRFHSWCPPEAAFIAADELGVYVQVEVASWPNYSTTLGDGKPVDAWMDAETERIVRAYGNHASFVLLCAGNEPHGDHHSAWLNGWVRRQKSDPRRLYTAGAGWPEVAENDYHIRSEPRIQQWGAGLSSRINALPPETRTDYSDFIRQRAVPTVAHEIGQWCAYPNYDEIPKFTGYLKPRNLEIFKESLEAKGMGGRAHDFLIASGKLQALCYKEDIEAALRTPEMGGFQLLGLQDFHGQGTALVGLVDAFWESKGYISAQEFRKFCASTVPLARLDKRVFTTAEHLTADIGIAHYGPSPLMKQVIRWQLVDETGVAAAKGQCTPRDIPVGAASTLDRVDIRLAGVPAPARYRLVVELPGTAFANDWDVWVYPSAVDVVTSNSASVTIVSKLDASALAKLESGGTVWLMAGKSQVLPEDNESPVALGFSSIFWNTAWTNGQAPHTLGLLCDPKHPALRRFPTDAHSNWQWWYPVSKAGAMVLDTLPADLEPIVQVIDDWYTNRKLGLIFEARLGKGRLLVTSIDLSDVVLDPVRRQLRASLLEYLESDAFQPCAMVTAAQIQRIVRDNAIQ